jgi:hypothetical protein
MLWFKTVTAGFTGLQMLGDLKVNFKCLGSFSLDPKDIRVPGMEATWNFAKGTGLL